MPLKAPMKFLGLDYYKFQQKVADIRFEDGKQVIELTEYGKTIFKDDEDFRQWMIEKPEMPAGEQ